MIEYYNKRIQNIIQRELFKAKSSIKIAVAWFTNELLFDPLVLKLQTGVSVELILNKDEINDSEDNDIDFTEFIENGGILHWNQSSKLMHDKFCIIDDSVVIYGSYNWTNKAEYNDESIAVSRDEIGTLSFYKQQFEKLCTTYPAEDCCTKEPINRYDPFDLKKGEQILDLYNTLVYRWIINEKYVYRIFAKDSKIQICLYNFEDVVIHPNVDVPTIAVKKSDKWGFYSLEERSLGQLQYTQIRPIEDDNKYRIRKDKWGVADENGQKILSCCYDNLIVTRDNPNIIIEKNNLFGIALNDKEVWPCEFNEITSINDYCFSVRNNQKWGIVTNEGRMVVPIDYDEVTPIEDNYYIVRNNNLYGVFSHAGSIIPCLYEDISYNHKDCFIVKKNDKYGYFVDNQLKIRCIYDKLCTNGESIKDGKKGVIAADGTIMVDFRYSQIVHPNFVDPPYCDDFYLVYEKPYYGVWINGQEVGKVHESRYSLQDYIPEFSLFNDNNDTFLEELRHAIVRTIYEDIVLASKKCDVPTRRVQFSSDNSFQSNKRYFRFRFVYTKWEKRRRYPFSVLKPLSEIRCERVRHEQCLFKEGDIMYIPKSFPVIQDIYENYERRYIIIKVYSPSSGEYYYTSFNPEELRQKIPAKAEDGKTKIIQPEGTAAEVWSKATSADDVFNILTHNKTKDCQICIRKIIKFLSLDSSYTSIYTYAYDL